MSMEASEGAESRKGVQLNVERAAVDVFRAAVASTDVTNARRLDLAASLPPRLLVQTSICRLQPADRV